MIQKGLFGAFFCIFLACQQAPALNNISGPASAPQLAQGAYNQTVGNCDTACVKIELTWPIVSNGAQVLKDSVQTWVLAILRDISYIGDETVNEVPEDAALATRPFVAMWQEHVSDTTLTYPPMSYQLSMTDTALCITPKVLSLRLDCYSFAGGAHPNFFTYLANFDVTTGQQIGKKAVVQHENAILPLLDKAYRELKKEAFEQDFEYEGGKIAFPNNFAVTEKGILFHYNPYEIAAWALGDADIFLTWEELGEAVESPLK